MLSWNDSPPPPLSRIHSSSSDAEIGRRIRGAPYCFEGAKLRQLRPAAPRIRGPGFYAFIAVNEQFHRPQASLHPLGRSTRGVNQRHRRLTARRHRRTHEVPHPESPHFCALLRCHARCIARAANCGRDPPGRNAACIMHSWQSAIAGVRSKLLVNRVFTPIATPCYPGYQSTR
jgi:hypothetical protein